MTDRQPTTIPISRRRVSINALSGVAVTLLNLIFIFWMYQYLLRRIPAEEFSIYPVLITITTFVPVLISLFAGAMSRNVVAAYVEGRTEDVTRLFTSTVGLLCIACTIMGLFGIVTAYFIDDLIVVSADLTEARLLVVLLVADVILTVFTAPFGTAFEVTQRFVSRDLLIFTASLLRIVLTFSLLVFVSTRVIWVPLASLSTTSILFCVYAIAARRLVPEYRFRLSRFDRVSARGVLGFGFWTSLGTISVLLYQLTGPLVLNRFSTHEQVNSYFIGSVFDRRLLTVVTAALAPVVPVVTAMSVSGDRGRLANAYLRGGRYALWVALAVACPLIVYRREFMLLYVGEGFGDAAAVMGVLLATLPFVYADVMSSRVAIAQARLRAYFGSVLLASVLTLGAVVIVVRSTNGGAFEVACVMAAGNVLLHLGFLWPYGNRLVGIEMTRFLRSTVVLGVVPGLAATAVWWSLRQISAPSTWFELVGQGMVGGLVYLGVLFSCLQPDERRPLMRVLSMFRGSVGSRTTP